MLMQATPKLALAFPHEILASYKTMAGESFVICFLPSNTATPYCCWRVDTNGNCYLGRYVLTYSEATLAFLDRINNR